MPAAPRTWLHQILKDRFNVAWLLLIAASFISWEAGRIDHGTPLPGLGQMTIGIAFAKVIVVGREFMELRLAPPALRWAFQAWAACVAGLLIVLYSR